VAGRPKLKADPMTEIGAVLLADRALSDKARETLLAIIRVGYSGVRSIEAPKKGQRKRAGKGGR